MAAIHSKTLSQKFIDPGKEHECESVIKHECKTIKKSPDKILLESV